MRAALPFRICAGILVLFAIAHTYGFLHFGPATPAGAAVKAAMDTTAFSFGTSTRTYGDFYRGFGLFVTAYLLFAALIALELPRLLDASPPSFRLLATALIAVQLISTILSWAFFAFPQVVLSTAVVLCIAWGMRRAQAS
jgi:hypothetical protein